MKIKYLLPLFFVFGISQTSLKAQGTVTTTTEKSTEQIFQELLTIGKSDANKILRAYISPLSEGLGFTQLEAWYHTAKPLKKWSWNIQVNLMAALIPESKKTFDLNSLGLEKVILAPGSSPINPTVFGPSTANPNKLLIKDLANSQPIALFNGTGVSDAVPFGALQLSMGLFKNTELTLRGSPVKIPIGSTGNLQPFGVGIKHDLKQWIPSIALSNFSLSLVGSYSILAVDTKVNISNLQNNPQDQKVDFKAKTWNVGMVISKRFSLLTLFASLRYDNVNTATDLIGTYKIGDQVLVSPYQERYTHTRIVFNGGAKLKLGKFFTFLALTGGKYPGASFGLGLGGNE